MAKTATPGVELEPIDRLEEKLKRLVGLVDRMKAEQARQAEENHRLTRELEGLRARLASSETVAAELSALRDERDLIRTRVGDMLEQLEALNL
jgi:regulator of replication initiation timing